MTDQARQAAEKLAPFKGPFRVEHISHADSENTYRVLDSRGTPVTAPMYSQRHAQWLCDRLNAAVPSPALPGEREAFEAMIAAHPEWKWHIDQYARKEWMWAAWQARASAPTVATPREKGATDTPPRTDYSAIDKTWTLEKVRIETEDLKFAVQYTRKDGSYGRWLTMCAYDVDSIAVKYAHDCNADDRPWTYRAVAIDPSSWQASRTPARPASVGEDDQMISTLECRDDKLCIDAAARLRELLARTPAVDAGSSLTVEQAEAELVEFRGSKEWTRRYFAGDKEAIAKYDRLVAIVSGALRTGDKQHG